jgi:hypothetical protein
LLRDVVALEVEMFRMEALEVDTKVTRIAAVLVVLGAVVVVVRVLVGGVRAGLVRIGVIGRGVIVVNSIVSSLLLSLKEVVALEVEMFRIDALEVDTKVTRMTAVVLGVVVVGVLVEEVREGRVGIEVFRKGIMVVVVVVKRKVVVKFNVSSLLLLKDVVALEVDAKIVRMEELEVDTNVTRVGGVRAGVVEMGVVRRVVMVIGEGVVVKMVEVVKIVMLVMRVSVVGGNNLTKIYLLLIKAYFYYIVLFTIFCINLTYF